MKIEIDLSEEDMETIEDAFFCELTEEGLKYALIRRRAIWELLCEKMGD